MNERGLAAALAEWAGLLARPLFWAIVAVLVIIGGVGGYLRGEAMADALGGAAARLGVISIGLGFAGFVANLICQYVLARQFGGDSAASEAPAIGKWLLLTILSGIVMGLVAALAPVFAMRLLESALAMSFAIPVVSVLVRLALLPVSVRLVSAVHSGNRHRIGAIARFLNADLVAWYGGFLLLALGLFALQAGTQAVGATGGTMGMFVAGGLVGGLAQAIILAFPLAAYRVLNRGRYDIVDVFN